MNCKPNLDIRSCPYGWILEMRCSECGKSAGEFFYRYYDEFDTTARAAIKAWELTSKDRAECG